VGVGVQAAVRALEAVRMHSHVIGVFRVPSPFEHYLADPAGDGSRPFAMFCRQ
jgi:hypothetical protein